MYIFFCSVAKGCLFLPSLLSQTAECCKQGEETNTETCPEFLGCGFIAREMQSLALKESLGNTADNLNLHNCTFS